MNFFDNFARVFATEIFFIGLLAFAPKAIKNCCFGLFVYGNVLCQRVEKGKTFLWQKPCKIIKTIYFFALEVGKTTSRCFFGQKSFLNKI